MKRGIDMTLISHFISIILPILKYKNMTLVFTRQQSINMLKKNVAHLPFKKKKIYDYEEFPFEYN